MSAVDRAEGALVEALRQLFYDRGVLPPGEVRSSSLPLAVLSALKNVTVEVPCETCEANACEHFLHRKRYHGDCNDGMVTRRAVDIFFGSGDTNGS